MGIGLEIPLQRVGENLLLLLQKCAMSPALTSRSSTSPALSRVLNLYLERPDSIFVRIAVDTWPHVSDVQWASSERAVAAEGAGASSTRFAVQ